MWIQRYIIIVYHAVKGYQLWLTNTGPIWIFGADNSFLVDYVSVTYGAASLHSYLPNLVGECICNQSIVVHVGLSLDAQSQALV